MSEENVKKTKVVKKAAAKAPAAKTVKKTAAAAAKPAKAKSVKRAVVKPVKVPAVKAVPKAKSVKPVPELPDVLLKSIQFLDSKKAEKIVILDLREVANISDYFVVATAANVPHLKSLSDGLQRLFKNEQYEGYRVAGTGDSGWIIADYYGVMVHVFSAEMRSLYDLEKLWKDARQVEIPADLI